MRIVDSRIDNPDDGVARSDGGIPCGSGLDVGSWRAGNARDDLPDVPKPPKFCESRIVRLARRIHDVVRLDIQDFAAGRESGNERCDILAARSDTPHTTFANDGVRLRVSVGAKT